MAKKYNCNSAHFKFDIWKYIPRKDLVISNKIKNNRYNYNNITPLRTVIANLLKKETNVTLNKFGITPFKGSTRDSLKYVINKLDNTKKIALSLPNWHYWNIIDNDTLRYFMAYNEKEFVKGFKKIVKDKEIGALIVASPANPMMYRLSKKSAKKIDKIAIKNNIQIIVDEAQRGIRPLNDRNSVAEYFTNPIVVEGFGKRFGDKPLGKLSYILFPQGKYTNLNTNLNEIEEKYYSYLLNVSLKYASVPAIKELQSRSDALISAIDKDRVIIKNYVDNINFNHKIGKVYLKNNKKEKLVFYASNQKVFFITLMALPKKENINRFIRKLRRYGIKGYTLQNFFPRGFKEIETNLVRFTLGQLSVRDCFKCFKIIANMI